jgi:alkanesulfonate monooxygenase SsuD/methylene tetrahydromethanopterin reductase-like flavin-dependent oxidoreductase (luciferase family)
MALAIGVCVLPDLPWTETLARWRELEAAGVERVWTYDHLSWRHLRDGPWLAAVPLLAAVAATTSRLRLGTLVAGPSFRHPVTFAKEVMTLDQISAGRVELGLGSGGTGADATVLGEEPWSPRERGARFAEMVELLDQLLRQPRTSWRGRYYAADDARQLPGCRQQPRVPFTVAASGPAGMRLAARFGQGWVTYGPPSAEGAAPPRPDEWLSAVLRQSAAVDRACEEQGRDPASLQHRALLGLDLDWAAGELATVQRVVGELERAGFQEVVLHAPRPHDRLSPGPTPELFERILGRP